MSKKLPTKGIANELSGASVFFRASPQPQPTPESPIAADQSTPLGQTGEAPPPPSEPYHPPSNQDTVISRHRDMEIPSNHGGTETVDTVPQAMAYLAEIRKAVKQLGKEAATYRFHVEEKVAMADIVYTYNRQGVRTSENEITRIAVNWLLLDYREHGANSVLARLLEALHG